VFGRADLDEGATGGAVGEVAFRKEGELSNKVNVRSTIRNRRARTWFLDQECKFSRELQSSFSSTSVCVIRTPTRVAESTTPSLLAKERRAPPPGAAATTDASATTARKLREKTEKVMVRLDVCV
jgi:hypothetical protein